MKMMLTTAALFTLMLSPLAHAVDAASSARGASSPRSTGSTASSATATGATRAASTATAASAPRAASKPASQQSKMKECNEKAAGKKGDERRAMMKECLSAKTGDAKGASADSRDSKQAAGKETQQSRMKTCNADAKGKSGDERKAFMKECLSNKPA